METQWRARIKTSLLILLLTALCILPGWHELPPKVNKCLFFLFILSNLPTRRNTASTRNNSSPCWLKVEVPRRRELGKNQNKTRDRSGSRLAPFGGPAERARGPIRPTRRRTTTSDTVLLPPKINGQVTNWQQGGKNKSIKHDRGLQEKQTNKQTNNMALLTDRLTQVNKNLWKIKYRNAKNMKRIPGARETSFLLTDWTQTASFSLEWQYRRTRFARHAGLALKVEVTFRKARHSKVLLKATGRENGIGKKRREEKQSREKFQSTESATYRRREAFFPLLTDILLHTLVDMYQIQHGVSVIVFISTWIWSCCRVLPD